MGLTNTNSNHNNNNNHNYNDRINLPVGPHRALAERSDGLRDRQVRLPNYLSIHPSIHLSIHSSIYPSIHLSIYPSIHLSIYLAIYLAIYIYPFIYSIYFPIIIIHYLSERKQFCEISLESGNWQVQHKAILQDFVNDWIGQFQKISTTFQNETIQRDSSWLVVWTPLKNISRLGWLFPICGKIKNIPNHQPASDSCSSVVFSSLLSPSLLHRSMSRKFDFWISFDYHGLPIQVLIWLVHPK